MHIIIIIFRSKKILTPEANNKSLRRTGEFIMLNTGVSVGTDGNVSDFFSFVFTLWFMEYFCFILCS